MRKILILGGNSDIGEALVEKIYKDYNISISVHYNKKIINKKDNVKYIKFDFKKASNTSIKKKFDDNYDVIVNLVGYLSSQKFLNFNIEEVNKTIKINSLVPFLIIQNSIKHMEKKKYGRIINTSSVGVKFGGGENTFAYSLSKHINEFIPSYIKKLCSKNINYNILRIGVTKTKFHKRIKNKSLNKRIKLIPSKKIASVNEISEYIHYIIKSNFIVNEVINITGGE